MNFEPMTGMDLIKKQIMLPESNSSKMQKGDIDDEN